MAAQDQPLGISSRNQDPLSGPNLGEALHDHRPHLLSPDPHFEGIATLDSQRLQIGLRDVRLEVAEGTDKLADNPVGNSLVNRAASGKSAGIRLAQA